MTDHYTLAEQALANGQLTASIAHAVLALVEEFRQPEPNDDAEIDTTPNQFDAMKASAEPVRITDSRTTMTDCRALTPEGDG